MFDADVSKAVLNHASISNYYHIAFTISKFLTHDIAQTRINCLDKDLRIIANELTQKILNLQDLPEIQQFLDNNYVETSYYLCCLLHCNSRLDLYSRTKLSSLIPQKTSSIWFYNSIFSKSELPPVVCVNHLYLNQSAFDSFVNDLPKVNNNISPEYVFSPFIGISNAHILYLMPSLYEKLAREILQLPPAIIKVHVNLDLVANRELLIALSEANLIDLIELSETSYLFEENELCIDHIAMTMSCIFLNQIRIPNFYASFDFIDYILEELLHTQMIRRIHKYDDYVFRFKSAISFHNRDIGYKYQPHAAYRDSNPNILFSAIYKIFSHKRLIRMGVNGKPLLIQHSAKLYDKNIDPYKVSDPNILKQSCLFIGTSSGPGHYAQLFCSNVLILNSTCFDVSSVPCNNVVVACRHINSIHGDTTFSKLLSLIRSWSENSVQHRELTENEVEDDIMNFKSHKIYYFSRLFPDDVVDNYPYLRFVRTTPRCFANIKKVLA